MTQEELRLIGLVQLKIMDEVHRLCVEHDITYYMIAGTLLGSVRHGGFIPWDVDIDIGMPRRDYEKFKTVCQKYLSDEYRYCDHLNMKWYPRPHALVCHTKSKIRMKYDPYNPVSEDHGIYIDVFPLDNAPDDMKCRAKQAKALYKLSRFKQYRMPYSNSKNSIKRYLHYAVSGLLSVVPVKAINIYQQKLMKKYCETPTECICSMASRYSYDKQCLSREIYGTPTLMPFEGREYYGPQKAGEYLKRLYGDYMQFPPLEKRLANLEIYSSVEYL
jgi:lipopolysaccharide cholinephosphotransferase